MPRRSQRQQAPVAAPGQPYGENQDQIQAQNVIPLPKQSPTGAAPTAPPGGPPAGEGGGAVAGGNPMEAALAAAMGTPPPGAGLTAPSVRPGEPVQAGMALGPGAGPEALGPSKAKAGTVADTFRMLADLTGDPRYQRLAAVALTQGA